MVGNAFLAEHEETLTPRTGRYWSPLRAQLQPVDAGEYLMHLDIFQWRGLRESSRA